MKTRLEYIDCLKGFAMLLVVMGHMIAWMYPESTYNLFILRNPRDLGLFNFIYSYHMPLFFFISGFCAYSSLYKEKRKKVIFKRAKQIFIPYIVSTLISFFLFEGSISFWFLIVLFEFYVIASVFIKNNLFGLELIPWVIIYLLTLWYPQINEIPYICLPCIKKFYPFFVMGLYLQKLTVLQGYLRKYVYPYSLLCFIILFYFYISNGIYKVDGDLLYKLFFYPLSFFAITFCYYFFKESFSSNLLIYKGLSDIGKKTMGIYIIHVLFKYSIPKIGSYLSDSSEVPFLSQLITAFLFATIIILLIMIIIFIIQKSSIISKFYLGKWT